MATFNLQELAGILIPNNIPASIAKFGRILTPREVFEKTNPQGVTSERKYTLEIVIPGCKSITRDLPKGLQLIGRSSIGPTIQLTSDAASRLHCIIELREDGLGTIQALETTNGTFLNGTRLTPYEVYVISHSDIIKVGIAEIQLLETT
jgi:hypothetical protein